MASNLLIVASFERLHCGACWFRFPGDGANCAGFGQAWL